MITCSGVNMVPGGTVSPEPVDIATGMCRITRYAGAIWVPLALHSIMVAEFIYGRSGNLEYWAMGMLHDAHEIVTGEVTRHWKPADMRLYEDQLDGLIFKRFKLNHEPYHDHHQFFKECDELALSAEAVICELPDWPNFYLRENGKPHPEPWDGEKKFAHRVLHSQWSAPEMVLRDSLQMVRLTESFERIAKGDYAGARETALGDIKPLKT